MRHVAREIGAARKDFDWIENRKEKPHRGCSQDRLEHPTDAARPGWAGNPASGYLEQNKILSIPGQVRVLFFLTRNARQLPLPVTPGEIVQKAFYKKTPLP